VIIAIVRRFPGVTSAFLAVTVPIRCTQRATPEILL
jgi:hypothetical protein